MSYSISGNNESDFTNMLSPGNYVAAPDVWTKFTYKVPSYAKYVAINCVSIDAWALLIDDIFIGIKSARPLVNYEVYLNGDKVGETTDVSYQFKDLPLGDYVAGVKAVYSNETSDMATIPFTITIVGMDDVNELGLNIYPNPVKDILHIDGSYTSIEIYDSTGKTVLTANGESSINVSNLNKGVYIIKAYQDDKIATYKIVK